MKYADRGGHLLYSPPGLLKGNLIEEKVYIQNIKR
jgi:hypothetical protein